ncbi:MAG: acyl-CoA dehydrogenase family protein [Dehalococcoidia bacterium]|nr:acyl-CoA dehydrogenase family protein [Dehalococcoidia bacterium]
MDFAFTAEQEQFRKEVRGFLEAELRSGAFVPQTDGWIGGFSPEFSRKLAQRKWIGLSWPKEYGGGGRGHLDRLILTEELLRCGAPCGAHWFADRQVGPCILAYGSEEQKRDYLPRIMRAEMFFGLGLSEPESGSDLASVKTSAVDSGDHFTVNGQKVWTSLAHYATHIYLVVRTDPTVPKHKGISELVVDMKLPGITVRPLIDMTGAQHFNEVFFDNVKVSKSCLIGKLNNGWNQITAQLDFERSGAERAMGNYPLFQALIEHVKKTGASQVTRHKLAGLATEFEVGRLLVYRVATMIESGKLPRYETAMAKNFCTEYEQRLARAAMEIAGLQAQLGSDSRASVLARHANESYLYAQGYTLMGGTAEILRNIIATRGLQLPAK